MSGDGLMNGDGLMSGDGLTAAATDRGRRVVVVPGAPVLLSRFASLTDPVAGLRAACLDAVAWLGDDVRVLADDDQGRAVAEELLGRPGLDAATDPERAAAADVLVVANGSARRSEKAPGHLDPRAAEFDEHLGALLDAGDLTALAAVDAGLADELLAAGLDAFGTLADEGCVVQGGGTVHAEDPFGVMYWVVKWQCAS